MCLFYYHTAAVSFKLSVVFLFAVLYDCSCGACFILVSSYLGECPKAVEQDQRFTKAALELIEGTAMNLAAHPGTAKDLAEALLCIARRAAQAPLRHCTGKKCSETLCVPIGRKISIQATEVMSGHWKARAERQLELIGKVISTTVIIVMRIMPATCVEALARGGVENVPR